MYLFVCMISLLFSLVSVLFIYLCIYLFIPAPDHYHHLTAQSFTHAGKGVARGRLAPRRTKAPEAATSDLYLCHDSQQRAFSSSR